MGRAGTTGLISSGSAIRRQGQGDRSTWFTNMRLELFCVSQRAMKVLAAGIHVSAGCAPRSCSFSGFLCGLEALHSKGVDCFSSIYSSLLLLRAHIHLALQRTLAISVQDYSTFQRDLETRSSYSLLSKLTVRRDICDKDTLATAYILWHSYLISISGRLRANEQGCIYCTTSFRGVVRARAKLVGDVD